MARAGHPVATLTVIAVVWRFTLLFVATAALFAALFAALTVAMTLLTRRIGEERLRRWVGGNSFTAPLKGLVFGVVTPFCSWSTVPVLTSLLRARVRTSAVAAFFIASPVLDPVLIVAISWLFGCWVAVWFTGFLVAATLVTAVVAERVHVERLILDRNLVSARPAEAAPGTGPGPPRQTDWTTWRAETSAAIVVARDQLRNLALPLAVTCAIGIVITGAVPQQLMVDLAGPDRRLAIPAAAALGVPVYLPTEGPRPAGVGPPRRRRRDRRHLRVHDHRRQPQPAGVRVVDPDLPRPPHCWLCQSDLAPLCRLDLAPPATRRGAVVTV